MNIHINYIKNIYCIVIISQTIFFILILLVEYIFFTTFIGLYFNLQLLITFNQFLQVSYMFHGDHINLIREKATQLVIQIFMFSLFSQENRPLPGFKPQTAEYISQFKFAMNG